MAYRLAQTHELMTAVRCNDSSGAEYRLAHNSLKSFKLPRGQRKLLVLVHPADGTDAAEWSLLERFTFVLPSGEVVK